MLTGQPVPLIIANALDASAARVELLPDDIRAAIDGASAGQHDVMARSLVMNIAANARIEIVLAMLAAAGGPATTAEIAQRWQDARDARATDAAARPAPFTVINGCQSAEQTATDPIANPSTGGQS